MDVRDCPKRETPLRFIEAVVERGRGACLRYADGRWHTLARALRGHQCGASTGSLAAPWWKARAVGMYVFVLLAMR